MKKIKVLPFRRKRSGKTDYKQRLRLLTSKKPRLVIRRSLKNIMVQFIEYSESGDRVIVAAKSTALKKIGLNISAGNVPSSYLTGLLAGVKAKEKGIKEAILDIGLSSSTKGSRIYSAVKGVIDSGIKVPCSKEVLPSPERVQGRHIKDSQISKVFDNIKQKIVSGK